MLRMTSRGDRAPRKALDPMPGDAAGYEDPDYGHRLELRRREPEQVAQVVHARSGADMPETLELATWLHRAALLRLQENLDDQGGQLSDEQVRRLDKLTEGLTKLDRSVRQWRRLQAEELGAMEDRELEAMIRAAVDHAPPELRAAIERAIGADEEDDDE